MVSSNRLAAVAIHDLTATKACIHTDASIRFELGQPSLPLRAISDVLGKFLDRLYAPHQRNVEHQLRTVAVHFVL